MTSIIADATRTAILSMDLQAAIVSNYTEDQGDFLARIGCLLKAARDRKMSVIHVQVGFRHG